MRPTPALKAVETPPTPETAEEPLPPPSPRRRRRRRHRARRWLVPAAVCGVLVIGVAVASLLGRAPSATSTAAVPLPTMTVTLVPAVEATTPRTLLVTGSLAAWDELPIGSEVTGLRIDEVLVDEGDHVAKGQLLAKLDDTLLRAQLAQNEAQIAQQEAAIAEADANVRNAATDQERARELLSRGAISQRDHDTRLMSAETTAARATSARRQLDVVKAQHQELVAKLAQAEIRAPADGTISKRFARLGAVQNPQSSELFRIVREDKIELQAEVPERDLAGIKVGQSATIVPDGILPATATPVVGTVRLLPATVDPVSRIGTVLIRLPDDSGLKPGQFVRASLTLGQVTAITLPEEAVRYRDGEAWVYVATKPAETGAAQPDGLPVMQVHERRIEIAGRSNGVVQVAKGVAAGEQVAVAGAGYIKDGDRVRVAPAASAAAP